MKASQRSELSPKCCLSGNASCARANALSRTNSLTERCIAFAAALSVRLASAVRRKSSFSDRMVVAAMIQSPVSILAENGNDVTTLSGTQAI
jgi:hypothetical protein